MVGRLYTVGGSFQLSRVRLCVCNEFLKILPFCVFFDNNDSGFRQVVRNRDNGLFIKGSALLGSERGVGRQIDESQCVSVRFGFGEFRPADFSVSPGFVFDDQGLAYILLGTVGQQTRACIRTGTGFISDNNLYVFFRFPGGRTAFRVAALGTAASAEKDTCSDCRCGEHSQFLFHD